MATTIIAKNQTGVPKTISQIGIPNNAIPASGQVTLTDYATVTEIQEDAELLAFIQAGDVLLNDGTRDLSQSESENLTQVVVTPDPTPGIIKVRATTTVAGVLADDFANGDSIDGVTLATDDVILIKDQASTTENGVYVVASTGAPSRASSLLAGVEAAATTVVVSEGSMHANTYFICTNVAGSDVVGTDGLVFGQQVAAGGATAFQTWKFSTTTTDSDPGSKTFRLNNATQSSATQIFVNDIADNGADLSNVLLTLSSGDRVYIQDERDSLVFHLCQVSGAPVDATTYVKIPITVNDSGVDLSNNRKCVLYLLFAAAGGGGGDNISVNGVAADDADFDDTTPTVPADGVNVRWQKDTATPNNISANAPVAAPGATSVATASAAGSASTVARSDHVHQSNTAPADVTKAAAAIGTSGEPARADHKHDVTTAAPGTTGVATASGEGSATTLARSDHSHQSNTAPADVTKAAATIGTSGEPARADHKHDVSTAAATSVGTANAEGSATSLARSDHTHQVTGLAIASEAQGDVLYRNDTAWVRLPAGTSGEFLQTQGAAANPQWAAGNDDDAIHDNVVGEINAVAEKASPIGADVLLIEDSAASWAKKKVQITNLPSSGGGGWPFANVITVDPTDSDADYTTIGAAITAASAGDAILISPDDYAEKVVVDKSLTLIGYGSKTLHGDGTSGITCICPTITGNGEYALEVATGATDVQLISLDVSPICQNSTAAGLTYGVYMAQAGVLSMKHCSVEPGTDTGFAADGNIRAVEVSGGGDLLLHDALIVVQDVGDLTTGTLVCLRYNSNGGELHAGGQSHFMAGSNSLGDVDLIGNSATYELDAVEIDGTLTISTGTAGSLTGATRVGTFSDTLGLTNPSEAGALRETAGPTRLPVGSVSDGQFLQRSGTSIVGNTNPTTASAVITDNAVVRGDGGSRGVQDSGITIDDNDHLAGIETATFDAEYDNGSQGATWTLNWGNGQKQKVTLTASTTSLTITAPAGPGNFLLKVIQGGTGNYGITWPSSVKWPNGNAPNFTNAVGSEDIVTFYYDGTNYYGVASLDFQ